MSFSHNNSYFIRGKTVTYIIFLKNLDELSLFNQGKLPMDTVQVCLDFVLKFRHIFGCHYHGFVRWEGDHNISI